MKEKVHISKSSEEIQTIKSNVCRVHCDNCMGTQVNIISGDYNCKTYAEIISNRSNKI